MSRLSRCVVFSATATLVFVALVDGVGARGGGGRGGGGFSRGGPAARGSFGQRRPAGGMDRGYNVRGPAADGSFGTQPPSLEERQGQRQERREERQDRRAERREDWQEYAEEHYEDHDDSYYGGYYDAPGTVVEDTVAEPFGYALPCSPTVIAMGGTIYYVCGSDWYIRAYGEGELVYIMVPAPTGH